MEHCDPDALAFLRADNQIMVGQLAVVSVARLLEIQVKDIGVFISL